MTGSSLRKSKRRAMSDINVVPYIDVMLVLLVIFMVTAPMVNPGVVNLPTVDESSVGQLIQLYSISAAVEQCLNKTENLNAATKRVD